MLCIALLAAQPALTEDADPPGRVGRISLATEGTRLRIGDSLAEGTSALNWPLTTGALIETFSGARSEAHIGSTAIRIDGGTTLEFLEVSDRRVWLRLSRGSILLSLKSAEQAAETALDTPQGRLRFEGPGSYRADVAGGTTAFSAYVGAATIEETGLALRAGDRILLLGGTDLNYLLGHAAIDSFRQWSFAREQADALPASRHVSAEMTGHEALDHHGSWRETADYGTVWFPQRVPVGWAPYRMGRWAWVPPWGWTWIDRAPWGFAPFHYGRWAFVGGRWAWLPGGYVARPVYAPALVVWLGQPGWNVAFSIGSAPATGWYPLGPREVYYPHYRSSIHHVRNVNVTHVAHVHQIVSTIPPSPGHDRQHTHRHRHEAVTVVPRQAVLAGTPIDHAAAPRDRHLVLSSASTTHIPPPAMQRLPDHPPATAVLPAKPALGGENQRRATADTLPPAAVATPVIHPAHVQGRETFTRGRPSPAVVPDNRPPAQNYSGSDSIKPPPRLAELRHGAAPGKVLPAVPQHRQDLTVGTGREHPSRNDRTHAGSPPERSVESRRREQVMPKRGQQSP